MESKQADYQSPKPMWASKLTLRTLSAILDIILIGVSSAMGMDWTDPPIVFFLPPACLSLAWNAAEGICIIARGGRRGIHPGGCIGADLVLWMGFAAASALYIVFGIGWYFDSARYFDFVGGSSSYYTLNRACVVLGFVEMLIHIVLFVIACYETSIRNRPLVVYTQAPPPGMVLVPASNPLAQPHKP